VRKGWKFAPDITDEDGTWSSFIKVCDPNDFLRGGFHRESLKRFKEGIQENAQILKTAKKALKN
jgi:hypothetical protein